MDKTLVALLRGINVGRAKRVAMADLRSLVTDLGYRDVCTLLNSGNIIFTVPKDVRGDPGRRIEKAIADRLDISSRVTVLTTSDLAMIVRENPLLKTAKDPSRLMITVVAKPSDLTRLEPLTKEKWFPEALALGKRVCYLWCPGGIIKSPAAVAVGKILGDDATTRNWATITKLHARAGA